MNCNNHDNLCTTQGRQTYPHNTTLPPSQPPITKWYQTRPVLTSTNYVDTTQTYTSQSHTNSITLDSPPRLPSPNRDISSSTIILHDEIDSPSPPTISDMNHHFIPFGDPITNHETQTNTLRIHHLNYNGFHIDSSFSHYGLAQDLWNINNTLHPDILSCNEINLNISNPKVRNSIHQAFKQVHQQYKLTMSHTPDDFGRLRKKPGGTAIAVMGHLTSRIKSTGKDEIGRWSYTTFTKKDKKLLTVISAYRVSTKFGPHVGHTTIVAQELRSLVQAGYPQNTDPRKAFITDIITFLQELQQSQHEIILLMDANEPPNTKDGAIQQIQQECQLYDALTHKYPDSPSPSSYKNGPHRLDYILISSTLLPHIQSITMLPFDHSEVISDHRPMLIDLDFTAVFQSSIVPPNPFHSQYRGVCLNNLKTVDGYQQHLRRYVKDHKVVERLTTTQRKLNYKATSYLTEQFNAIDEEYGRYMLASKRKAAKQFSKTPPWSPTLHQAGSRVRYWRSRQSSILTNNIFEAIPIQLKWKEEAAIEDNLSLDLEYVRHNLSAAWKTYRHIKKHAFDHRLNHLTQLAKDTQRPEEEVRRVIQKIIQAETSRKKWDRVKATHHKPKDPLLYLLIKAQDTDDYTSIQDKDTIDSHLLQRNYEYLQAAKSSLLLKDPLSLYYSPYEWLHNALRTPNTIPLQDFQPIEQQFLKLISVDKTNVQMSSNITISELKNMFTLTDELTSSSPSGRHYGLYKAITDCPDLILLHHILVSTPFQHGFILTRGAQTTQIMLKKKTHPWIDKLRIIELFEADYNTAVKIYMRRLMFHQIKHKIVQDGTYGSLPGGSTYDALFTRKLTFDLHHITKEPLLLIDNDAKACYDRIIPTLATHLLTIQGVPANISEVIHKQLISRQSHVMTGLGISTTFNQSSLTNPLYGIGQGSGAGPAAWHAHLLKMIQTLNTYHPGYHTIDPTRTITYTQLIVTFVDDTSFLINIENNKVSQLILKAEHLINDWLMLLQLTGGDLSIDKSTWSILIYDNTDHKQPIVTQPPTQQINLHINRPTGDTRLQPLTCIPTSKPSKKTIMI